VCICTINSCREVQSKVALESERSNHNSRSSHFVSLSKNTSTISLIQEKFIIRNKVTMLLQECHCNFYGND